MSDVSPVGLGISLALVGVAIALSAWQRLGVEGKLAWSATRALAQLLIVGSALAFVLAPEAPLALSGVWVALMAAIAAETAHRRAPEVPRGLRLPALASFGAAAAVTLGILFGFGIFPLEPRTLVPLGGMVIGNSMTACVLVSRRVVEELADHRRQIEARLALGHSSADASRGYLRNAVRTALTPQIETTKTVGLVFLPGAMTGLLLAGVDPLQAVMVQIVVMYLVLAAAATTTVVTALATRGRLFTPAEQLVSIEVKS